MVVCVEDEPASAEVESEEEDARSAAPPGPPKPPEPPKLPADAPQQDEDQSKKVASQQVKGSQSYYYWHSDAERRRQISGEVRAPPAAPQKLDESEGGALVVGSSTAL
eukprot:418224-Prymnesium_polylepis.1